jgi:CubicO group peptidase (beta-lactamase class C family)
MKRLLLAVCMMSVSALFAQDMTSRIDKFVEQYSTDRNFRGTVLVAEDGQVVYVRGFGQADPGRGLQNGPQVQYRIASITKSFTATMIMKLVDQGKIALTDPITKYLPAYRHDTGDRVTIHHLLTHSSGIPDFVPQKRWRDHATEPAPSLDQVIETWCSDTLSFAPGSKYAYSTAGYVLLGAIIQKVTGQTYEQALHAMILDPAGMQNSGLDCSGLTLPARAAGFDRGFGDTLSASTVWNIDWVGAGGAIYATPEDLVKWDHILYDPAFIPRTSLRLMNTAYFPTPKPGISYGYGFTLSRRVRTRQGDSLLVMSHEGSLPGFNSLFSRVPGNRQMVFIVSNASTAPLLAMTDGIFSMLNGHEPAPVKRSMARELYVAIERKGAQEGLRAVESDRYAAPARYDVVEGELDALGHQYMHVKHYAEAEAAFGVAVREFPKSTAAYDNLGECYTAMGQKEKAIVFYKKSIALDPQGTSAKEALRKLSAD